MIPGRQLVLVLLLGLVLRLGLSTTIYSGDVNNHIAWAGSILLLGSNGAYERQYTGVLQPTYPPLALYSFVTSYWLYRQTYSISQSLNHSVSLFPSRFIWFLEDQDTLPAFHKIISILSDLGTAVLIFALARRLFAVPPRAAYLAMLLYLFNPAVFYNSSLWGQLESPPLFFVLLSVWLLLKKRPFYAHAAFVAALLFKQSSLIFLPAFLIFSFFNSGLKKTLFGLAVQFCLFILCYLPFSTPNSPFSIIQYPISVYLDRLQVGSGSDYISDHAFNLWALYSHLEKIPDSVSFIWGWSANLAGKVAFMIVSGLLLIRFLTAYRNRRLIYVLGLTAFAAFMLLTRMHERYLAPVLPLMAITAASRKQLWPIYFLLSTGHLINMYHQWWFPDLPWLMPVINQWPAVVLVIIIFTVSWLSWTAVFLDEN
jgi:Gpi18-like mannosyltransferase